MTIGRKLTAAFGAMAGCAALVTFVSQGTVEMLRREMAGAVNVNARRQRLASQIGAATAEMAGLARGIVLSTILQQGDKAEACKRQYREAASQLDKAVADYRALADGSTGGGIDSLASRANSLGQVHQEFLSLLTAQQMDAALKAFDERVLPRVVDISAAGAALVEKENAALSQAAGNAEKKAAGSFWISFSLLGVLAAVSVFVLLLVFRTSGLLARMAGHMSESAGRVASAASQVSSTSQSLAQGASEQTAALERTAHTTTEIASVTRSNTENVRAMAGLMGKSREVVGLANQMLDDMVVSMRDINASSDKISRIIKTIDGIAFQTNILALNAAVEAARAGSAGLGFAVVADEVRNLAQRSAAAARDTAELIEESITTSKEGKSKLDHVAGSVQALTRHTGELGSLVEHLNEGSQRQAAGMEEISGAVSEIGQVTHRAAASAEESASAGSELDTEAETLNGLVQEFSSLVGTAA